MKESLGEKLSYLSKRLRKSQSEIALEANISHSQLNKFFNDKSNLSLENFNDLLICLGIDLQEIIEDKIEATKTNPKDKKIISTMHAVEFLLMNLEPRGRQTQLKQLEWINEIAGKEKLPKQVTEILRKEINLI